MNELSQSQQRRRKRKELIQGFALDYFGERHRWVSIYDLLHYIEWEAPHKKRLTVQSLTMLIAPLVWNGTLMRETRFIGNGREPCYILTQYADSTEEEE
jgi:hypothetical protein